LIACPVSIRSNWVDELKIHLPGEYEIVVCDTTSKKSRQAIEDFMVQSTDKLKIMIVGIESMSAQWKKGRAFEYAYRFMLSHTIEMVVDEGHLIKNHDANRSKNCVVLGRLAKKRLLMTGTPIAQGPMDLYMQFEYLNPEIIGVGDFYSFRNRYAIMGGYENREIVGYDHMSELMELIKPWVFQCTKKETLDLPEKLYTKRIIQMTTEQRKLYNKIKKDRIAELPVSQDATLVAENVLVMYTALQQITGGFISYYREDGEKRIRETEQLPGKNPKVTELMEVIAETPDQPMIIWARYKYEIKQIMEALSAAKLAAVEYHGDIPIGEARDEQVKKFKSGKAQYIVATQDTGGVGNTWNEAHTVVYFSNSFKLIDRKQSEDRCHRIGQTNNVLYIDLVVENSVDESIIEAIKNKQDLATFVQCSLKREGLSGIVGKV
jgi:SNF2 family DNA or RNA helicase